MSLEVGLNAHKTAAAKEEAECRIPARVDTSTDDRRTPIAPGHIAMLTGKSTAILAQHPISDVVRVLPFATGLSSSPEHSNVT